MLLCRAGRVVSRLAPPRPTAICRPGSGAQQTMLRPSNMSTGICRRQLCTKPPSGQASSNAAKAPAKPSASGTATAAGAQAAPAAEAAPALFAPKDWLHWSAAIGAFYVANDVLYKSFAAAGIQFPASLIGMFGILGGLWTLSAIGQVATAEVVVAAATPALRWITRYLPLFYVPALVVLPLAAEKLSGAELGKIAVVLSLGVPFSLFSAGAIVMAIRRLASVALLPVPPVAPQPPFTMLHLGGCVAVAVGSALALLQADKGGDLAYYAQQLHLLAWTVGGLVFGSIPPTFLAAVVPHPVIVTTLAATCGTAVAGAITGNGYYETLKTYLTKGKNGQPKGAGDHLMSFLGVVVLTFGFHIYGQRALLVRHAAEVVGCAVICSLLSMIATAGVARMFGLTPELCLALVPRSVTVALAMPIATQLGVSDDTMPICAAAVLATGLVGALLVQRLLNIGGFTDPLVRGLACASSCHGLGLAALAATEPAALPFCALSYGLTGIAASLWAAVPAVQSALRAIAGAG